MLSMDDIYNEMDILLREMEDEDAKEEVLNELFPPRKEEMQTLLNAKDLDEYLQKYDEICQNEFETLMCFDTSNADELKKYIEEEQIDFNDLKTETVRATYEVLEEIIFQTEEDYA